MKLVCHIYRASLAAILQKQVYYCSITEREYKHEQPQRDVRLTAANNTLLHLGTQLTSYR